MGTRKVIMIQETQENKGKPVEFTHYFYGHKGWEKTQTQPSDYEKVVYLGECGVDGDMFAAYSRCDSIEIFKGHLNSGTY